MALAPENFRVALAYDAIQYERLVFRKINSFLDGKLKKGGEDFGIEALEPLFDWALENAFPEQVPSGKEMLPYLSANELLLFLRGYSVSKEGVSEISKSPDEGAGKLYSDASRFIIATTEFSRQGYGGKVPEARNALGKLQEAVKCPALKKGAKEEFSSALSEFVLLAGGEGFDCSEYGLSVERAGDIFNGILHYNRRFSEFGPEELKRTYLEIASQYLKESRVPLIIPPERGLVC